MRRRSVIAVLVFGALITGILLTAYGLTRRAQAMTVRLNVKDIKEHGLEIITPLDPSFDHLAAKYFKGKPSAELEAFRPFSVFIKNRSNKYLVAYVLKWEILRTDGTATTGFKAYAQPGVLMGYG